MVQLDKANAKHEEEMAKLRDDLDAYKKKIEEKESELQENLKKQQELEQRQAQEKEQASQ